MVVSLPPLHPLKIEFCVSFKDCEIPHAIRSGGSFKSLVYVFYKHVIRRGGSKKHNIIIGIIIKTENYKPNQYNAIIN